MFLVKGKSYKIDKNDKTKIKMKRKEGVNQITAQLTLISSPFGGQTPPHTLSDISSDITIVIQV